jgi:thiamine-phosphate pyrophosphorylase
MSISLLRIIDANANRASEGLRVVEEYVRFVLDDRHLTGLCKQLRHDLTDSLADISADARCTARDTQGDVGTDVTTPQEFQRNSASDVVTANLNRVEQSLRCLEEYAKALYPAVALKIEPLRYRVYTLQRAISITASSRQRLEQASLYVLLDGGPSRDALAELARSLIDAGVHILQLRDKRLNDRLLLDRARLLRELTRGSGTLLIINDRPDIAALSDADGVHVGQEELSVKDARTIVGADKLVGVSTHSIHQARQAVLDGANYIGAGPTFPSGTKHFDNFPGLGFLRAVAAEITLPAFAIGGISETNLPEVLAAGICRIAVSGAVTQAVDPSAVARQLVAALSNANNSGGDGVQ